VETTGVAEPDALVFDIQESLPRVRLDGVVTVADADTLIRFPQWGHTLRMQIEAADTILLNKMDLITPGEWLPVQEKLRRLNNAAPILSTQRCRVDPDLLFGIAREREIHRPEHIHQPDYESFSYSSGASLRRSCFEEFVGHLPSGVYRAKGFVRFPEGSHLFNFVAGRWELEPFHEEKTALVFIGRDLKSQETEILSHLRNCES